MGFCVMIRGCHRYATILTLVLAGASTVNAGTISLSFHSAYEAERSYSSGPRGGTTISAWVPNAASSHLYSGFMPNQIVTGFSTTEYRTGMEFDLSSLTSGLSISQVILNLSGVSGTSSISSLHTLAGFVGDGVGSFVSSTSAGAELTAVPFDALGSTTSSIDVTNFVIGLIAADEQYAGFTLDSAESITSTNIMAWSDFSLTIIFDPASPLGNPDSVHMPLPPTGGMVIFGLIGLVAMRRRYLA